jgi:hypothetical protein
MRYDVDWMAGLYQDLSEQETVRKDSRNSSFSAVIMGWMAGESVFYPQHRPALHYSLEHPDLL